MTGRDVVVPGGMDSIDEIADVATAAEDLGYDRLSLPEVTGRDAVTVLATLAERTDDIGLSNDVFSPYGRSPAVLGQTGVTLQELSGGRYRLGLGTSSPALTEQWHLADFERPLRRLRETIDVVDQVTAGDRIDYHGECFDGGGLKLQEAEPAEVPIDVAALGPKAAELAGRFADGWVPQMFTPDGIADRMDDFERGADLGDRNPGDLRTAVTVRSCVMEDAQAARDLAARGIAFLVAAYGPYYRQSIADQGFEDETEAINGAWADGDRAGAVEAVTDEMIDGLAAVGTPEDARETVERFESVDGLDAVRVGFFAGVPAEHRTRTMEVLAPGA